MEVLFCWSPQAVVDVSSIPGTSSDAVAFQGERVDVSVTVPPPAPNFLIPPFILALRSFHGTSLGSHWEV